MLRTCWAHACVRRAAKTGVNRESASNCHQSIRPSALPLSPATTKCASAPTGKGAAASVTACGRPLEWRTQLKEGGGGVAMR
eukprot:4165723-Alexandrium_andersonii.AAC.1